MHFERLSVAKTPGQSLISVYAKFIRHQGQERSALQRQQIERDANKGDRSLFSLVTFTLTIILAAAAFSYMALENGPQMLQVASDVDMQPVVNPFQLIFNR